MVPAKKKTARGRKQDRARVAGKQDYEVNYEAKKTRKSASVAKRPSRKSAIVGSVLRRRLRGKSADASARMCLP